MNKITKVILGVVVVVIVAIALVAIFSLRKSKEQETIKIGMIVPMTGNRSYFGESHVKGATIAIEEINAQGGINGKKLKLVVEDDQGKPIEAVNAFNKLFPEVDIFLTATLDSAQSLAPLAGEKKKYLLVW